MGFLTLGTAPTAPKAPVVPSMTAASHSTVPRIVKFDPIPALVIGSSSRILTASTAASKASDQSRSDGLDDERTSRARSQARWQTARYASSDFGLWYPAPTKSPLSEKRRNARKKKEHTVDDHDAAAHFCPRLTSLRLSSFNVASGMARPKATLIKDLVFEHFGEIPAVRAHF